MRDQVSENNKREKDQLEREKETVVALARARRLQPAHVQRVLPERDQGSERGHRGIKEGSSRERSGLKEPLWKERVLPDRDQGSERDHREITESDKRER